MIAVISDVHGNYPALRSVLDDIEKQGIEKIISLGDIAGYYCFINECIDTCRNYNVINILGNHDFYLISGKGCPRSRSANVCLKYQSDVISEDNRIWLTSSYKFYDDDAMSLRHGGWNDPLDEYLYDFDFSYVEGKVQKLFASGHTHIQKMCVSEDKLYFNPGSVGQPRDYDCRAAYAVICDDGSVLLKRVDYSIEEVRTAMRQHGFEDRISNCLQFGSKIGEELQCRN